MLLIIYIYIYIYSSNGTYINHKKIRKESVILKNNDKIIFVYKNFKNHKGK